MTIKLLVVVVSRTPHPNTQGAYSTRLLENYLTIVVVEDNKVKNIDGGDGRADGANETPWNFLGLVIAFIESVAILCLYTQGMHLLHLTYLVFYLLFYLFL